MATAARRLAFRILRQVERGGTTLADLLAQRAVQELPARERGFLHELVMGTLRHRGFLDHALAASVERGLDRLEPDVLTLLRIGASQILRLRVPDRAAVHETVELTRAARPRAAGLVNAALRRLAREGAPKVPDLARDPTGWLTTAGSLPPWLAARWVGRLGASGAIARARAALDPPRIAFRLNPRVPDAIERVRAAGVEPQPLPAVNAWTAPHGASLAALSRAGVLYLQDGGSQMVARLASGPGLVLDACAAPGGKALLMADAESSSRVVAMDGSVRRVRSLTSLSRLWGAPNVSVLAGDALRPPFGVAFDTVLLDAPCSGLGTLSRHPDIRWRCRPEDLPRHAEAQGRLIESLATLVASGGRLVYATCSSEPEENEEVVAAFLERRPDFLLEPPPDWASPFRDRGYARTSPETDGSEAFFAAVLRRRPRVTPRRIV
jgi:16S rRNA (cytosine967-C5)-methyltransferase